MRRRPRATARATARPAASAAAALLPAAVPRDRAAGIAALAATLAAAFLLLWAAGPARAGESALPTEAIGVQRGDTLRIDLEKVIAAARENNDMVAAAGAMADAAAGDALAAWGGFLPHVSAGEYFLRTDNALKRFGFRLNRRAVTEMDFAPDLLNDPGPGEIYNTQLKVEQPLFNGGMAIYGKRAADAAGEAARLQHGRATDEITFAAIQAYNGLALARAYEDVVLQAIAAAEGHVRQAKAMVDAEMATDADRLQAMVHLSGLQQRLIEVRNQVAMAGKNIELLTGVDTDLPMAPATALAPPPDRTPPPLSDFPSYAERADVLAGRRQADAARGMARVARGSLLPHVNLAAERNWWGNDLFPDEARSWTVGVYGTWNLFAGLQNVGAWKKARARARAAEYMARFRRRQARVEATGAWLGLKAALDKVAVARDAVAAAREGLRILDNQYREGLASMVDLLDTEAAHTQAEGNLVQALHDYHVSLARLRYTGAPTAAD